MSALKNSAVEWHYLDHGFWLSSNGDLERLSSRALPWLRASGAVRRPPALVRRPRAQRPRTDGADWTHLDREWWISKSGRLARIAAARDTVISAR